MKVTVNRMQTSTLEDFADKYGLELVVDERGRPVGDPRRFYARFRYTDVRQDGCLVGVFVSGDGASPADAIENYTEAISGKILGVSPNGVRHDLQAPKLTVDRAKYEDL